MNARFGRPRPALAFLALTAFGGLGGCASVEPVRPASGAIAGARRPAPAPGMRYLHSWAGATLREREAVPIATQSVEASDGSWRAQIEANLPPEVSMESGVTTIVAELDWDEPVRCFVYRAPIDVGRIVSSLEEQVSTRGPVRPLRPYALTHSGLDPLVHFRTEPAALGSSHHSLVEWKVTVMPRAEYPFACLHRSSGYARSFARVVSEFAESFVFKREQAVPRGGELWFYYVDKEPEGFSRFSSLALRDGGTRTVELSSSFGGEPGGGLVIEDRAVVSNWSPEGTLRDARFLSFQNARAELDVALDVGDQWGNYHGEVRGQAVSGRFAVSEPLRPSLLAIRSMGSMGSALPSGPTAAPIEQLEYHPEEQVAGPVRVRYSPDAEQRGWAVHVPNSIIRHTFRADDTGRFREVTVRGLEREIHGKMVFRLGADAPE